MKTITIQIDDDSFNEIAKHTKNGTVNEVQEFVQDMIDNGITPSFGWINDLQAQIENYLTIC